MKINKEALQELLDFTEAVQDKILNEEYDDIIHDGNYTDEWELIEDFIRKILDIPNEKVDK